VTVGGGPFELLARRAEESGERVAFVFLGADGTEEQPLTYAQLAERSLSAAGQLAERVRPGDRVLLLHPPGNEFLVDLFACWALGAVAVPAALPLPGRESHALALARIVADCTPRAIVTTDLVRTFLPELLAELAGATATSIVVTGDGDDAGHPLVAAASGAPCMLQYTSGSTREPRGVMLTWENLSANLAAIRQFAGQGPGEVAVIWLPHYHDMGLGTLIGAIYGGYRCVWMSPLAFLKQPLRWLAAITHHRATSTVAPNFAFELCTRRVTPADLDGLDLSSLEIVVNGAEPLRQASVERFVRTLAPAGLRPEVVRPAYGLAESVMFVSGVRASRRPRFTGFDRTALLQGAAVGNPSGRSLAALGTPAGGHELAIVAPASRQACPADEVGEIWLRGPSVASGYWCRPEETEATFGARTADGSGPYLRTGDLGFLHDGELYVSGRLKDVIIVRGANHYPQDLEWTVEDCHPAIRRGCTAAFTLGGGEERIVVTAEVRSPESIAPDVGSAVRAAVAAEHGLMLHGVGLLAPRTAPRTSSGKIRRRACRALWDAEPDAFLARWCGNGAEPVGDAGAGAVTLLAPQPHAPDAAGA
jgi:acyl-CoA synthetase (AMP-forming)/AMP-acid ligase II